MGTSMITTTTTEPIRADRTRTESDDSDRPAAEPNAESNHYSSEVPR
ncbi:hypothetical protein [Natrialba sp. SSL1]|nr:hypothetical protein [Natrialba sp. SSL1]